MTIFDAHRIIRKKFKDEVASPHDITTIYDNQDESKPEDKMWCRFTILPVEPDQITIGESKTFRYPGAAIVQLFVAVGKGDKEQLQMINVITNAFRCQTVDSITWLTPIPAVLGRIGNEWQVNVSCPFYFEDIQNG